MSLVGSRRATPYAAWRHWLPCELSAPRTRFLIPALPFPSRLNTPFPTLLLGSIAAISTIAAQSQPVSAQANWSPAPEPAAWLEVRQALIKQGPPQGLSQRDWTFIRAYDGTVLRVGEYLADPVPTEAASEQTVEFEAALIMLKPQLGPNWTVRERRMRALCGTEQRLQLLNPAGDWVTYTGDPDPDSPNRLAWICRGAKPNP